MVAQATFNSRPGITSEHTIQQKAREFQARAEMLGGQHRLQAY